MANSNVSTRDTQLEKQRLGYIAITFSNMDATTEPKIQAGSVCEVAGTLYSFTTEESNTGWAGIGNSTQAYLYLDPAADGTSVSAVWTDTTPAWDEAKYGYYASGTSNRYVLRCYKDSSSDYTQKYKYEQLHGNRYIDGDIDGDIKFAGDNSYSGDNTYSTGDITFNNGADLGGNGTALNFKIFTGSLDGNGDATIVHGLILSEIIGMNVSVYKSSTPEWESAVVASFNTTNIILNFDPVYTQYRLIVWYT